MRRGSTLGWLLAVSYDAVFVLTMLAAVSLATLGWPSLRAAIRTE